MVVATILKRDIVSSLGGEAVDSRVARVEAIAPSQLHLPAKIFKKRFFIVSMIGNQSQLLCTM